MVVQGMCFVLLSATRSIGEQNDSSIKMKRSPSFALILVFLSAISCSAAFSTFSQQQTLLSFHPISTQKRHRTTSAPWKKPARSSQLLFNINNDKDDDGQSVQEKEKDNFDGQGFTNYLAPYILAFFASIAITAGFVKFVLMDY
jgi:hypothetical protein